MTDWVHVRAAVINIVKGLVPWPQVAHEAEPTVDSDSLCALQLSGVSQFIALVLRPTASLFWFIYCSQQLLSAERALIKPLYATCPVQAAAACEVSPAVSSRLVVIADHLAAKEPSASLLSKLGTKTQVKGEKIDLRISETASVTAARRRLDDKISTLVLFLQLESIKSQGFLTLTFTYSIKHILSLLPWFITPTMELLLLELLLLFTCLVCICTA